jgi:hypothetical protein
MHHYDFNEPEPHTSIMMGLITCILIVAAAAMLGKAMVNLQAALISKPDVGIYFLLPDMELGETELLRDMGDTRDYYADSKDGPLLVHLHRDRGEWTLAGYERLHGGAGSGATVPTQD